MAKIYRTPSSYFVCVLYQARDISAEIDTKLSIIKQYFSAGHAHDAIDIDISEICKCSLFKLSKCVLSFCTIFEQLGKCEVFINVFMYP